MNSWLSIQSRRKPFNFINNKAELSSDLYCVGSVSIPTSYKTFYVAGPTIENIHEIKPLKLIVKTMIEEYEAAEVSS